MASNLLTRSRVDTRALLEFELPVNGWAVLWVVATTYAWLLPNHQYPWLAFHSDAWMAAMIIPLGVWAFLCSRQDTPWPRAAVFVLAVATIPPMQALAGLHHYVGTAWIYSAYLFAFATTILVGARWEQCVPGSAESALFAAFVLGGIASVGLQLCQWLRVDPFQLGFWLVAMPYGDRPAGNLGQPNQLSTLLIWGLAGLWWACLTRRLRPAVALLAAAFLLFGLAMAQSRAAWLALGLMLSVAFIWRKTLASGRHAFGIAGLALGFVAMVLGWEVMNQGLQLDSVRPTVAASTPSQRVLGWTQLLDALSRQPWLGVGWGEVMRAQYGVVLDHPALHEGFSFSHNLILDLLLWNGVALGSAIILAIAVWVYARAQRAATINGCLLLLSLLTFGVHSLVEFPHGYAYFILPVGLIVGVLSVHIPCGGMRSLNRWSGVGVLSIGVLWFGITVHDYLRIEASLVQFRLQQRGIGNLRVSPVPEVLMLDQLKAFLDFMRVPIRRGMPPEELELMRKVAEEHPAGNLLLAYARASAINGRPEVARDALARMCKMTPREACASFRDFWHASSDDFPELRQIAFPAETGALAR